MGFTFNATMVANPECKEQKKLNKEAKLFSGKSLPGYCYEYLKEGCSVQISGRVVPIESVSSSSEGFLLGTPAGSFRVRIGN